MMDVLKKLTRRLFSHPLSQELVRTCVRHQGSRRLLNQLYCTWSPDLQSSFHSYYAKIFRDRVSHLREGFWKVELAGQDILMPLRTEHLWLDWDSAVSIVGHDIEIKQTYRRMLSSDSEDKPELFVDIGANYGTHSLLFLVHGVPTLTFEPNRACHPFFEMLCRVNEVNSNLQPIALGAKAGTVQLTYPQKDTWLGSIDPTVVAQLKETQHEVTTEMVEQKMLDDYLPELLGKKVLLKLDTEGHEMAVLKGASEVLQRVKPQIIFESWNELNRQALYEWLNRFGYQLQELKLHPPSTPFNLSEQQFITSTCQNFIAVAEWGS